MLVIILYGIAIVCLAAASVAAPPVNRWLIGVAIVCAVIGMIAGTTGTRITIGHTDYRRPSHADAPA
jgi:hypothetical protein